MKNGNVLEQKRAVEGMPVADPDSQAAIAEIALRGDSLWVQEVALRSCRYAIRLTPSAATTIRLNLFRRYLDLTLIGSDKPLSVLFSSSSSLEPIEPYLRLLMFVAIVHIGMYAGILGLAAYLHLPLQPISYLL